jgi:hypothetical protein
MRRHRPRLPGEDALQQRMLVAADGDPARRFQRAWPYTRGAGLTAGPDARAVNAGDPYGKRWLDDGVPARSRGRGGERYQERAREVV